MHASRLAKRIKIAAIGAVFFFGAGIVAAALHAAPPPAFETKAKRAILMDAAADLVLFEKDADTLAPPASMSKLMTLAIVFRELKAGRITLETEFKVSEHAWRTGGAPSGGSAMFAPLNTMVTISDLIQGITV
ncbi:MAG TPA: serine hydrolase, partial [Methyloceanibacter sp.]|nr:serine hydrolase [Methyloceanibacter sp.]